MTESTQSSANTFNNAVLFDLDGVLLDSREAMRRAILGTATAALGRRVDESLLGPDLDRLPHYESLAHLGVLDKETAFGAVWETALAVATRDTVLFRGAVNVLRTLRARGSAIGVVTMQPRTRLAWLVPEELSSLFHVVVGWGDAEPKPSGAGIALALEHLEVHPARACFVGDSPTDIAAATAAGVPSIGAAWGYTGSSLADHHPTVLVHALSDVPAAVAKVLG
ncbi:HAD family hydrolase [Streptomyces eurocidicus]|uniref:HAD superfamily hydrolase (TIGR01509 family) n=1 Tax=Streptomyces eurocidicus TaxID=66423 RepID=A0A7W8F2Z4_STREU|nr:HAD family hydrolase [Streptomyces eurocidicus]MBB5121233.1 HAD superfamily hydrolase (TIGR01509 family) [Streptomyces eurocidicus]MBF6055842.1 HAD hydrolase-like protein [Streptomyces eurocidicus]